MDDLVVILMTLGFFALCLVYVALCDRIVGPDEQDEPGDPGDRGDRAEPAQVAVASPVPATATAAGPSPVTTEVDR